MSERFHTGQLIWVAMSRAKFSRSCDGDLEPGPTEYDYWKGIILGYAAPDPGAFHLRGKGKTQNKWRVQKIQGALEREVFEDQIMTQEELELVLATKGILE